MVNKTYKCKIHGEFTEELKPEEEIKECPECKGPVMRVFKPITSIWNTSGACGKVG